MIETAQSIENQEIEKAQAMSMEMETRKQNKDHSDELEEKARGARKKS